MKAKVNKNHILLILALAQFMVVLDVSIVNMAIPAISRALEFKPSDLQWVVTAYTLTFGGFLLFGGRAADLFGRRKVFMAGTVAFTFASLLVGLSQSDTMLIALRAVQGLAAAFMSPAALSIVLNTFKEGGERNKALGVWGGVAAGGAAAGILVGGVLTEYLGWRWNFFVNVPVGALLVYLIPKVIPESKSELKHRNLDLPGAVLVTAGMMLLVFTLTKVSDYGWGDDRSLALFSTSIVLLGLFIVNELRAKHPLMPLDIFRTRNLGASNIAQVAVACSLFSMFFFLSLYIQTIMEFSPIRAGLGFLPVAIVIGISSAIVSVLVTRIGYKIPMVIAPLFLAAGLVFFSRLPVDGAYLSNVLPGLVLISLGLGFSFVTITIAATSGVPHDKSGLASGILNTSQQIGGALGLAILSTVFASKIADVARTGADFKTIQVSGYHDAFLVGAGFATAASLVSLLFIRRLKKDASLEKSPAAAL